MGRDDDVPKGQTRGMKEDSGVVSVRGRMEVGEREREEGGWQTLRAREDKVDAGWLREWKKDEGRHRERSRSSRIDDWRRRWKKKKGMTRSSLETREEEGSPGEE